MRTSYWALIFAVAVLAVPTLNADTHYLVPAGTEGNTPTTPYTNWVTAANALQDVMTAASADDLVLVRKGVYDADGYVECKAVTIRSYDPDNGGAINAEATILDGSNYSSPYEFMQLNGIANSRPAVIEGITYSNFNCTALKLVSSRDTKILSCIFTGNGGAVHGGAIYLSSSYGSVISNCTFTGNALSGEGHYYGGAIYDLEADYHNFVDVIDSTFTDNTSSGNSTYGGAIYASKGIRIRNCSFSDNKATGTGTTYGGTIYAGAYTEISGCTFTGACGATYGQLIDLFSISGIITNCTFTGLNYSGGSYGLIIAYGGTITDCAFTNNTKINDAFIMAHGLAQDLNVRNCLFANNSSYTTIFKWYSGNGYVVAIDNCTILAAGKNILTTNSSAAHFKFRNDILFGTVNTSASLTLETTNCSTTDNGDFVPGGYRLKSTSPCIDAGANLAWHAGAKDLGGRDRVVGAAVDIGCYERQTYDSDYLTTVRAVATADEKTGDWADAYVGIQAAVDAAPDYSLVEVKSGTYNIANTIVISNRTLDVKSVNPATGTTDRDGTVLDGKGATRIMIVHPGPFVNDVDQIPQAQHPVRVEGFTFKDGFTSASDGLYEPGLGAGLLLFGRASAEGKFPSKIVGCRFTGCSAVHGGGAAMLGGVFENCLFDGNAATGEGGGAAYIARVYSSPLRVKRYDEAYTWYAPGLIGCVFTNNTAVDYGGAFAGYLPKSGGSYGTIYVVNCGFYDNRLTSGGSQTFGSVINGCYGSTISNCVFKGNSGAYYGVLSVSEFTHLTDCTFTGNAATYGIVSAYSPDVVLNRCRFSANAGCCGFGSFTAVNTLFAASTGNYLFGAYLTNRSYFENCTFASTVSKAAINTSATSFDPQVTLSNCLLWRQDGGAVLSGITERSKVVCSNCCFATALDPTTAALVTQVDCVTGDPKFRNSANGDWSIRRLSPCRDAGRLLDWMDAETIDFADNPRVVCDGKTLAENPFAKPDIGCYENQDPRKGFTINVR